MNSSIFCLSFVLLLIILLKGEEDEKKEIDRSCIFEWSNVALRSYSRCFLREGMISSNVEIGSTLCQNLANAFSISQYLKEKQDK